MNKRLRILGIDPGSRIAGFACVETIEGRGFSPRDFKIIDVGVLRASAELPHAERLGILHDAFRSILASNLPDICVMERAFTGVNSFTALRLGEARGALIAALSAAKITLVEMAPAHIKKTIAGSGAATKEQVAQVLSMLWKFDLGTLPFDASDALAIALTYGLKGTSTLNEVLKSQRSHTKKRTTSRTKLATDLAD